MPDLLYAECANILWKHVRRGALVLAIEHDLSAYDACYVALAKSLAWELITADERLVNKLSPNLAFVRWLGDPAHAFGEAHFTMG